MTTDSLTEQPATPDQAADDTDTEPDTDTAPEARPATEAARYRRRLRETETERDGLRDQLAAAHARLAELNQATVAGLAAAVLSDPDDLARLGGLDLEALPRTEAGALDTAAVRAAIDALAARRPELTVGGAARARTRRLGPPPHGQGATRGLTIGSSGPSWAEVLRR